MWRVPFRLFSGVKDIRMSMFKANTLSEREFLEVSKVISEFQLNKLRQKFGKEEYLKNYFKVATSRVKKMQTSDLMVLASNIAQNTDLRKLNYTAHFWPEIAEQFKERDLSLNEMIEASHLFCFVYINNPVVGKMYKVLENQFLEIETNEFFELPFQRLEDLLWSFSYMNMGSSKFYKLVSNLLPMHAEFDNLSFQKLAKLAYFFSRTKSALRGGNEFIKSAEKIIWTALHQGRIKGLEEVAEIIHFFIPNNIGSNKFRSLLEFVLFSCLTNSKTQITAHKLVRVVSDFTHYNISYEPLEKLLKQLVLESLEVFTQKELIEIIWAYSRHNKAEPEFYQKLLKQFKSSMNSHTDIPFRHFTYMVNGFVNAGVKDPKIWKYFESLATEYFKKTEISDHYLVRLLSLFAGVEWDSSGLYKAGKKMLMQPSRLPLVHPKDLTRSLVAVSESKFLHFPELVSHLDQKVFEQSHYMGAEHMAQSVYSLAKINRGTPEVYELLEKRILDSNLAKLSPRDLGVACLGFGQVGMSNFCKKAVYFVNQVFHSFQGRVYESDSETEGEGDLVVAREKELEFSSEIPATSVVQMAWMAAASGYTDPYFWTEGILEKLASIPMRDFKYSLNEWIWTAKSVQEEEDQILAVDPFHFGLLMQILAMFPPKGSNYSHYIESLQAILDAYSSELKSKVFENTNNQKFVKEVKDFMHENSLSLEESKSILSIKPDLVYQNKWVLLHTKEHYVYLTKGYQSASGSKDLLTHHKVKKHILKNLGVEVIEICKGDWNELQEAEKLRLFLDNKDDQ